MKKIVDTIELESFLNEKSVKEGDECIVEGAGTLEEKTDQVSKRMYKVLNIPVSVNGRELIWTPNKEAVKAMQIKFGMDTQTWINQTFKVKFYPKTAFGITRTAIMPVF